VTRFRYPDPMSGPPARPPRHYSGVLIRLAGPARDADVAALDAIDGVEIHRVDAETGRCVAVLESDEREGQEALFELLRRRPGVVSVELVYHLIDREAETRERDAP
jgi:nitrate reductase NapAB chaperone NapD